MSAGGASRARAGGRPLPGRAARAPKRGRLLPLVLRLQGPTSGEFRRTPSSFGAERCLCPARRLAGDPDFGRHSRGAPVGRALAINPGDPSASLSSASDSSFPVAGHQPAPPAPLESIISFLLQTSPRGGVISPTFLRIWFTRNCLSGESYFPPVYLALSLNWSLFLAVLIAIFLNCSPVVGSPSTHPFSRFSLVGTFFYIFCSELPIPLIFPPSPHPPFWSQSHPVSGLL